MGVDLVRVDLVRVYFQYRCEICILGPQGCIIRVLSCCMTCTLVRKANKRLYF